MLKTCYRCKQIKDLTFFHKKGKWHQPYCKDCHKIYRREHYLKNRQKYINKAGQWRNKVREEVRLLKDRPCMDCGVKYPYYVMQFDHRENKEFTISLYIGSRSRERISKEIAKCDLICANCHAVRSWNRKNATVTQSVECLFSKQDVARS